MSFKLNAASEAVLREVQGIVETIDSNISTNKADPETILSNTQVEMTYGGRWLAYKVSDLMRKMDIAEGSQFTVTKFRKPTVISKKTKMYLVILSENAILTPGGKVDFGYYTIVGNQGNNAGEIILDPGATIIFITPRRELQCENIM